MEMPGVFMSTRMNVMPLCLAALGSVRDEEEAPFRHVRHAGPDLLAVDDVVVAVEHGARLEIGEVAARVGLGEALAPDLLGGEDLGQVPLALGRRAMAHDGRGRRGQPAPVERLRRLCARHLLVEDDLLHDRGAAPPVLGRPVHAHVARAVEPPLPGA